MKEIGSKLQKKRIASNLSIEDVANKTKMGIDIIEAIESGDIGYFKENLTFVRFYVRSYCNAIDVPYEDFKLGVEESVVEYTDALSLKKIEEAQEMEDSIKRSKEEFIQAERKDRASINFNTKAYKKKRSVDFSFVSLLVITCVVVALLVWGSITLFFNGSKEESNGDADKTSEVTPLPEEEKEEEPTQDSQPEQAEALLQIQKTGPLAFSISGESQTESVVEITFSQACYFEFKVNGVIMNTITTYDENTPFSYNVTLNNGDDYALRFGNFQGAKPIIKVDGVEVAYDAQELSTYGDVIEVALHVEGVTHESAQ